jgi:hypothetical protein
MAADYYSALIRTISSLASNTPQARQSLYDRARSNIVGQLRRRNLHASAHDIALECAALEIAIKRVEAESNQIDLLLPQSNDVESHNEDLTEAEETAEAKLPNSLSSPPGFDMATMPERLGAMLIGIAVAIALLAFAGLMYLTFRTL